MQETMSNEHAMRFPFVGSAMLLSLFLLFKFLPKDFVNAVLTCYFFVLGIVALLYVFSIWVVYHDWRNWFIFVCFIILHVLYLKKKYLIYSFFFHFVRATLLPAIKRYLPEHWNQDVITWHFPYFRCMCCFLDFTSANFALNLHVNFEIQPFLIYQLNLFS